MAACTFCQIVAGALPCSRVFEDDEHLGFMDIHPLRPGHVLIVPKRHAGLVAELPGGAGARLFGAGMRVAAALRASAVRADAVNFLLNDGTAANQTVPHVHLHVVPRRRRDTGKLLVQILRHPFTALLRPAPRAILDEQAAAIAAHVA